MKKLIVLLLVVILTGCWKTESPKNKEVHPPKAEGQKVEFKFAGKKLLITNHSENILTVLESETKFSLEENRKWLPVNGTSGLLSLTFNVLKEEVYEYDLTKELSEIDEKKIKVTVFYAFDSGKEEEQYEMEILYKE